MVYGSGLHGFLRDARLAAGLPLYGAGMHQFVLDEVELGRRAAQQLDDPEQWFWACVAAQRSRSALGVGAHEM